MKLLNYELQIYILCVNYGLVVHGKLEIISKHYVPRVWNGKPAKLGQFPYQVGLVRPIQSRTKGLYGTFCGGAIIGRSKVLTAAHCLAPDDNRTCWNKCCCKAKPVSPQETINSFRILAGNLRSRTKIRRKNTTLQTRRISSYNYPDKYDFPEQDICIITTDKPWAFNKNVGRLPYASKHIEYGSRMCTASGFGILNKDPKNPVYSETMMWENFKLLTQAACKKDQKTDMKNFVCTDNKVKDVTQGDSGGPLVCKKTGDPRERDKGIIVGVVCGDNKNGNFFTRVSSYTKFVDTYAHAQTMARPLFCIFIELTLLLLNP